MANVRAFRNGNWSDTNPATSPWGTGGVLYAPASTDVVYANSFTVQMNVTTVTGLTLTNAASASILFKDGATTTATAGGSFNVSTLGITINANVQAGTANCVTCSLGTTGTFTVNGTCTGAANANNASAVVVSSGAASLTVSGNCTGGSGSSVTGSNGVSYTGTGVLSVAGVCTGGSGTSGNCFGVVYSGSGGSTASITGNCIGGANNSSNDGVRCSAGSMTIAGSCTGSSVATSGNGASASSIGNLTITGDVFGGAGGGNQSNGVIVTTSGTVVINGNATGGTGSNSHGVTVSSGTGTVTINGNVTGGIAGAAYGAYNAVSSATIIVNGTAIASDLSSGIWNNLGGTVQVTRAKGNGYGAGTVGKNPVPGLTNNSTGTAVVKEIEFGALGQTPVSGPITLSDVTTNVAVFYKTGGTKTLTDPNAALVFPAALDVRFGTSYNSGNLTGTLRVPAASSVAAGVSVDNTVGTAVLTQANVWDYSLATAAGTSGSVGEKLKKTSNTADLIALG